MMRILPHPFVCRQFPSAQMALTQMCPHQRCPLRCVRMPGSEWGTDMRLLSLLSLLGEQKGSHLRQMWQIENVSSKKHLYFLLEKIPSVCDCSQSWG